MKQRGIKQAIGLIGFIMASAAFSASSLAADKEISPKVKVSVFARHVGDKIMYHYVVRNNTEQSISALSVGRDSQNDSNPINDILELAERPSGWNPKFGIPASSYNAPNGWRASMTAYDSDTSETTSMPHAITWEILNDKSPLLDAGQSSAKFSITVDKPDSSYLNANALVVLTPGSPASISVPVELADTTPPTLTVILSPNMMLSNNEKPVAIKASFEVKDDYDSMPRIMLESVTTDEPQEGDEILDASLGLDDRYFKLLANNEGETDRVFTVYYSATDAAGNQTLSSATVTVTANRPQEEQDAAAEKQAGENVPAIPVPQN